MFNMVAQNTREGNVLQRWLQKLDLIREQIGNDRVYDVISDIFEEVEMEDIITPLSIKRRLNLTKQPTPG